MILTIANGRRRLVQIWAAKSEAWSSLCRHQRFQLHWKGVFRSPHLIFIAIVEIKVNRFDSSSKESQILSIITPFNLEAPDKAVEELLTSSAVLSLSTVFNKSSPESIKGLHWALSRGRSVDIDIQATLSDSLLEGFEDMITGASVDIETLPPIILCMILYIYHLTQSVDHKAFNSQHFTSSSWSWFAHCQTHEPPRILGIPVSHRCPISFPQCLRQVPSSILGCAHSPDALPWKSHRACRCPATTGMEAQNKNVS